jgi:hypothetical protein
MIKQQLNSPSVQIREVSNCKKISFENCVDSKQLKNTKSMCLVRSLSQFETFFIFIENDFFDQ